MRNHDVVIFGGEDNKTGQEEDMEACYHRGWDGEALVALADRLTSEGAVPRFVSTTLGSVQPAAGDTIEVDVSLEAAPAVLYDALVLPDGTGAINALRADGRTLEFIKDQYRHCKPILRVRVRHRAERGGRR